MTSFAALIGDLEQVRRTGVAFDNEEHTEGICTAGVLVHDLLGNPLAVSVPVPTARYLDRQKAVAERVLEVNAALEKRFGNDATAADR